MMPSALRDKGLCKLVCGDDEDLPPSPPSDPNEESNGGSWSIFFDEVLVTRGEYFLFLPVLTTTM